MTRRKLGSPKFQAVFYYKVAKRNLDMAYRAKRGRRRRWYPLGISETGEEKAWDTIVSASFLDMAWEKRQVWAIDAVGTIWKIPTVGARAGYTSVPTERECEKWTARLIAGKVDGDDLYELLCM